MQTAVIKASWISRHPTGRMDAPYWIAFVEECEARSVDPDSEAALTVMADIDNVMKTQTTRPGLLPFRRRGHDGT